MIRRALATALLVLGVSSCMLILPQFDDSGTGGATTTTGGKTTSSSTGTGGATTTTGSTTTSSSGMGGMSSTTTSSSSGGGGTTTTTSSSGGMCTDPATDCSNPGTKCVTVSCSATHMCESADAAMDTACTDNGGAVCDGNGKCVGCNTTADCTGGDVCMSSMCVPATCSDGLATDDGKTDVNCGGPNCPPCTNVKKCLLDRDCTSGFCNSGTCEGCSKDTDCATGFYCNSNGGLAACTAQQAQGMTCVGSDQCTSGFCADGVCCNTACTGTCQACSAAAKGAGQDGICANVVTGVDPHNNCTATAQSTCGISGTGCNGSGACQDWTATTQCAAASCTAGSAGMAASLTPARLCSGSGTCQAAGATTSCVPYTGCNGIACATTCTHDSDCIMGDYCNAQGHCAAAQANGATCTGSDANQCTSGFCSSGVCTGCTADSNCASGNFCTVLGNQNITMGGLYGGGGMLNNKQLILNVDNAGAQTLTFAGGSSSANEAAMLAAIHTQWPSITATQSGNDLLLTDALGSSIVVGNGTANGPLGLVDNQTSNATCSEPFTPACNTTTGTCVQCTATNSTACTGATPVCNTSTNTCVP